MSAILKIQLSHHELSLSRPRIMQFSTNLVENYIILAENYVILDYFDVFLNFLKKEVEFEKYISRISRQSLNKGLI